MFESKTGCYSTEVEQVSATQRVKNECLLESVKWHFSDILEEGTVGLLPTLIFKSTYNKTYHEKTQTPLPGGGGGGVWGRGGGDSHMKRSGMLVGKFELNP